MKLEFVILVVPLLAAACSSGPSADVDASCPAGLDQDCSWLCGVAVNACAPIDGPIVPLYTSRSLTTCADRCVCESKGGQWTSASGSPACSGARL